VKGGENLLEDAAKNKGLVKGGETVLEDATKEASKNKGFFQKLKALGKYSSLGMNALQMAQALKSGDREGILQASAGLGGEAVTLLSKSKAFEGKIPGGLGGILSASGNGLVMLKRILDGNEGGAYESGGQFAFDVGKQVLSKNPIGAAIVQGINVGQYGAQILNALAPDLHASTDLGQLTGQAAFAVKKLGAREFYHQLAGGLANDERANSNNVITRTTGQAAQALGKGMQAWEGIGDMAGVIKDKLVERVQQGVQKFGEDLSKRVDTAKKNIEQGIQTAGATIKKGVKDFEDDVAKKAAAVKKSLENAIPCKTCWPWDEDCKRTMWDCHKFRQIFPRVHPVRRRRVQRARANVDTDQ